MATLLKIDGTREDVQPDGGRKKFRLPQLQELVGGYIELVRVPGSGVLVVNEEGKNLGLPLNRTATELYGHDYIVGPALLCRHNEID